MSQFVEAPPARPSFFARVFLQEDLNFLVTNRIPRRWATLFMGWFSKIEWAPVRYLSIATWRYFASDLDFSEARKTRFRSMHDCFTRQLKDGARTVDPDPDVVVSPCDGILGAMGRVEDARAIQAKGFPYSLRDLLGDDDLVAKHRDGIFITLRLKSSMYHRFHAPCDGGVRSVNYISGDTWNVNPIALRRVEQLFCKNERAVLDIDLPGDDHLTLVPVAAILVASIRMHFLAPTLNLLYRGPNHIPCDAQFAKGDELGYFEHGSTILLFASGDLELADQAVEGSTIRMGQPLLRRTTKQPLPEPRNSTDD